MNYKTKQKLKDTYANFKNWFYTSLIRPAKKYWRKREHIKQQRATRQAMAQIVENFEPFLNYLIDECLSDYRNDTTIKHNHYTVQAVHDIKAIYKNNLKNYINSQK